ncbi:hypothetical protein MTR_5g012280 [Medicago truncatula]|uniref:Uncharacterized protein n=1 Tax=Medicago truncatula TaxID=3880 RepID=G7JW10_MEDTR|nr:hypothetical protein MTR_5g012280 [Medicago truncatula]
MDNNKNQTCSSSNSSSTVNFNQLFSSKDSTTASFSSFFDSLFPQPSVEGKGSRTEEVGSKSLEAPGTPNSDISNKNTNSTDYQNETVEPTYFSSSIHYGGCEDYFSEGSTIEPRHVKYTNNGDLNGNNSNSASRGDWWQGSLYY